MRRRKIVIQHRDPTQEATVKKRAAWQWWWLATIITACIGLAWWGLRERPEPAPVRTNLLEADYPKRGGVVREQTNVATLLAEVGVAAKVRSRLAQDGTLDGYRTINAGHRYTLTYNDELHSTLRTVAYEADEETTVEINLRPYARVRIKQEVTEVREQYYSGIIRNNIWFDILESPELHHALIPLIEEAAKYTVDVFHLQPGDRYQIAFTEKLREGRVVGVQKLLAFMVKTFDRGGITHRIYNWSAPEGGVYLTGEGISVKSKYLQAPVRFAIISSPYSRSRRHPVTGVLKPHKGIDYAAPEGSPIFALADGRVEKAAFEKNNGNNVRLIHDKRHKTQYLHMSKIASGVRPGASVRQGEVIGYVGQTGLATGPHVCLRFWEDGRQVDFLANEYTYEKPLPEGELRAFFKWQKEINRRLEDKRVVLPG